MVTIYIILIFLVIIAYVIYNYMKKNESKVLINKNFNEKRDVKIKINEINNFYITFNEHTFDLSYISLFYDKKVNKKKIELIEILPSIYFFKNEGILYIFIKNVRDTFHILIKSGYSNTHYTYETSIDPKILPYPTMLGNGCPIWTIFKKTKFYRESAFPSQKNYSILKDNDILEITANDKRFKKEFCENTNNNCYSKFLKAFLNNTFEFDPKNKIQISKFNDCYRLEEGKHRVCAFKRYKKNKIEVELTEYNYNLHCPPTINEPNPDVILKDYYESYANIGIKEKEANYITENIDNKKFIEYFEKKYKKDIFQVVNILEI